MLFDLDRRRAQGFDLAIFAVNRALRYLAMPYFFSDNNVQLILSTQEARASFSAFSPLHRFIVGRPDTDLALNWLYSDKGSLTLKFTGLEVNSLGSVEVDMCYFTPAFDNYFRDHETVRFQLESKNGRYSETSSVSMAELRRNCFLLLSFVITSHAERVLDRCPQMWLNGSGQALRVFYPWHAHKSNWKASVVYPEKLRLQSCTLKRQMSRLYVRELSRRFAGPPAPDESLLGIWKRLADQEKRLEGRVGRHTIREGS